MRVGFEVRDAERAAIIDDGSARVLGEELAQGRPLEEAGGDRVPNGPEHAVPNAKLEQAHGDARTPEGRSIRRPVFSSSRHGPWSAGGAGVHEPEAAAGQPPPHDCLDLAIEHVAPGAVLDVDGDAGAQVVSEQCAAPTPASAEDLKRGPGAALRAAILSSACSKASAPDRNLCP